MDNKYITYYINMNKAVSATTSLVPSTETSSSAETQSYRSPSNKTLEHAVKLAIVEDKPIMMDYWTGSIDKTVLIGVNNDDAKQRMLVRSEEEYTSPIHKIYKIDGDYILMTENSIYVVDNKIPIKRISS